MLLIFFVMLHRLTGIYLRYIPFSKLIDIPVKEHLFKLYTAWLIIEMSSIYIFISYCDLTILSFKLLLILSSIPYILFNILIIKHRLGQHLFICSMQFIYSLLVHGIVAWLMSNFVYSAKISEILLLQLLFYTVIVLLTIYPLIKILQNLFTIYPTINHSFYWNKLCILPALLCINIIFLMVNDTFISSWPHLLSRIILFFSALLICYAVRQNLKSLSEHFTLQNNAAMTAIQLNNMTQQTEIINKSCEQLNILRHDMRHQLNIIASLLTDNKTAEALAVITKITKNINAQGITRYCKNMMINAVLSVYFNKAANYSISLNYQINIPEKLFVEENSLAIVIANLLENALIASQKLPIGDGSIIMQASASNERIAIRISNKVAAHVELDTDGLPKTNIKGHGIGMHSLIAFQEKYDAVIDCDNNDGWFIVSLLVCSPQTAKSL